jgi:4-carboxymuconolactone decarboxylase
MTSTAISNGWRRNIAWARRGGDGTLSPRQRGTLTLGMVAAIGKIGEFGNHFRGAVTNGLTQNELRAVLTHITIHCGIAVGADRVQAAGAILHEGKGN